MSATQDKKEARARARSQRAQAHEKYAGLGGGLFIQPFIQSVHPAPGDVVAGYVAKGDEADPGPLIQILADHGCKIALARVVASGEPLEFIEWALGEILKPGAYDILEPTGTNALLPDFVLVPLLAFSPDGHRLGYGGGYYDRTLEALRAKKPGIVAIGLAYAAQEVTNLPVEPEDQPLDWIVTERGSRCFQD